MNMLDEVQYIMDLQATTARIWQALDTLKNFTANPGKGVTRLPYTTEAKQACSFLREIIEDAGLQVRLDNSGALIGRLEGVVSETVLIGSHFDSVKNGGAFDGIAGVVCAIEVARALAEDKVQPYYSLEVIATNDEEGARFHAGLFTGKVMAGQISVADLQAHTDENGISIYQAMVAFGLHPDEIQNHVRNDIKAFMEIHIEQGPVLEAEEKQIGIVDVIVGIKRALITVHGRADHSGTMPMHMRKDALELATKAISKISDRARNYPGSVATVGFLQVEPNVMNIIPQKVSFTVDIRGTDEEVIKEQYAALETDLQHLSDTMDMKVNAEDLLWEKPVAMDEYLRNSIELACDNHGFTYMHLPSGAGHDAQIFAERFPTAMIFVPSENGRSHCPEEYSNVEDLAAATQVMYDVVAQALSNK